MRPGTTRKQAIRQAFFRKKVRQSPSLSATLPAMKHQPKRLYPEGSASFHKGNACSCSMYAMLLLNPRLQLLDPRSLASRLKLDQHA
jgi:hypothetical protein